MITSVRRGATTGALFAVLIVLGEPFYPPSGLIPELVKFFTMVPLWMTVLIFGVQATPLHQAAVVVIYFLLAGALIGAAFREKPLWGWLLVIVLVIHHYSVADRSSLKMGEVVQQVLNYFS